MIELHGSCVLRVAVWRFQAAKVSLSLNIMLSWIWVRSHPHVFKDTLAPVTSCPSDRYPHSHMNFI